MKVISTTVDNPGTFPLPDSEVDALLRRYPQQDIFVPHEPERTLKLVPPPDDPAE